MTTAARDAQHFREARAALKALVASGAQGATGKALLGESWKGARWGYMLLRRLELAGIVHCERVRTGGMGHPVKLFFPTDELAEIVDNDEELGAVLWPKSHDEPEVIEDEDAEVVARAEALGRFEGTAAPDFDAPLPDDAPVVEPLEALVQMSATVLQNVVYMREKLDELRQQVADLRKAWE